MERVAPSQLNYDDQLPIAIESKSQRREFYPEGGSVYGPNGGAHPNVVRIPINADSMLDVQNSYLRFNITSAKASSGTMGFDFPQSIIKRVRISSGGVVLEDINSYNRLYCGILYPTQATTGMLKEGTISSSQSNNSIGAVVGSTTVVNVANAPTHNVLAQFATATTQSHTVHLASGLLNMDKYIPLVMMNAGFIIELEFDVVGSIGIASGAFTNIDWTVSDIRYMAHLVDLQRDFYDRLRMVMEGSGGVLQLAGQTYRHFSGSFPASSASASINVPARVKSIKSIFFKNTVEADIALNTTYGISNSITKGITSYQFRIGSVVYPPTAVQVGDDNKGEAYQELRKAFGTVGSLDHGGVLLNSASYLASPTACALTGGVPVLAPYALDFEAFNRTALESGVNSADRSLPITLELTATTASATPATTDVYVLCDAIFYVNLDGTCSVSI
mgnify:CR=1 FL=1|tara:strand:- start:636 stop:1976 length:1341 start_codon:yes stop_codon:yes gene_type:complete